MVIIQNPVDEQMQKELEEYEDEFKETLEHISELRKQGKDTKIIEIMILGIAPKFKMVRVTYDPDDLLRLRKSVKDLKKEMKSIDEGVEFEVMLESVHNVYEAIFNNNINDAISEYSKLMEFYKKLEPELKKLIYPVCVTLNQKICNFNSKNSS